MKIRGSVLAIALAIAALDVPSPAGAQSPGKTWRVGMLSTATPAFPGHAMFVQTLRERGYIEGQNLTIVSRYARGQADRLPALAAELAVAKVDVIVTAATVTALAARKASGSIPIVALTNEDPVAAGLAASLARPGGNVTGVVLLSTELAGKRLELLKQLLPRVSRIGVLTAQGTEPELEEMQGAAQRLGVHLVRLDVATAEEVDRAFERVQKERAGAMIVLTSAFLASLRQRLVSLAARHRLPVLYPTRTYAEAGGLIAYGQDVLREGWTLMAILTDRILKGARPADLPFEQLTKIELIINARTARALGLTIPPSLLTRAEVIE